jgi:hypothetical protein
MAVTNAIPPPGDGLAYQAPALAEGGILLIEREMRCDQGQDAAGLQGVNGFGEEVIIQGKLLPLVFEFEIGERHVADHGVDAAFW